MVIDKIGFSVRQRATRELMPRIIKKSLSFHFVRMEGRESYYVLENERSFIFYRASDFIGSVWTIEVTVASPS